MYTKRLLKDIKARIIGDLEPHELFKAIKSEEQYYANLARLKSRLERSIKYIDYFLGDETLPLRTANAANIGPRKSARDGSRTTLSHSINAAHVSTKSKKRPRSVSPVPGQVAPSPRLNAQARIFHPRACQATSPLVHTYPGSHVPFAKKRRLCVPKTPTPSFVRSPNNRNISISVRKWPLAPQTYREENSDTQQQDKTINAENRVDEPVRNFDELLQSQTMSIFQKLVEMTARAEEVSHGAIRKTIHFKANELEESLYYMDEAPLDSAEPVMETSTTENDLNGNKENVPLLRGSVDSVDQDKGKIIEGAVLNWNAENGIDHQGTCCDRAFGTGRASRAHVKGKMHQEALRNCFEERMKLSDVDFATVPMGTPAGGQSPDPRPLAVGSNQRMPFAKQRTGAYVIPQKRKRELSDCLRLDY